MDIKAIKIDANGKSKEEIKKELLEQVEKEFEKSFKEKKKTKPSYLHIKADEDKGKTGFGVEVEFDGDVGSVLTMLTVSVSQALHSIANDNDDEYTAELLLEFVNALIAEYTRNALSEGEEEENGN